MAKNITEIVTIVQQLIDYLNGNLYLGEQEIDACFDCNLWNNGYEDPTAEPPIDIPPLKETIAGLIDDIIEYVETVIADVDIDDYGFKTQLQRFIDIMKDVKNKILAIQCDGPCPDVTLLAQLQMTLIMTAIELVSLLEMLQGLLVFYGVCGCIGDKFFEIMMGRFINAITSVQCIVQDWSNLVMAFFQFQTMTAKTYVAAYVPKAPLPQPTMQYGGFACVPCPPRPIPQPQPPVYGCNPGQTGFGTFCH